MESIKMEWRPWVRHFYWGFTSREKLPAERAHRSCSRTTALKSKRVWNSLTADDRRSSASKPDMLMSLCLEPVGRKTPPRLTWQGSISCQAVAWKTYQASPQHGDTKKLISAERLRLLRRVRWTEWLKKKKGHAEKLSAEQCGCLDNNIISIIIKMALRGARTTFLHNWRCCLPPLRGQTPTTTPWASITPKILIYVLNSQSSER